MERTGRASLAIRLGNYFVTEQAPKPEKEENERSTMQYREWDFSLPVIVLLLEMSRPFPVLVNCQFGDLHKHIYYSEMSHPTFVIGGRHVNGRKE
jgi:hypothetical protein